MGYKCSNKGDMTRYCLNDILQMYLDNFTIFHTGWTASRRPRVSGVISTEPARRSIRMSTGWWECTSAWILPTTHVQSTRKHTIPSNEYSRSFEHNPGIFIILFLLSNVIWIELKLRVHLWVFQWSEFKNLYLNFQPWDWLNIGSDSCVT